MSDNHSPYCLGHAEWYCIVRGRQFGPWPDKGAASAGYATELRRAVHREQQQQREALKGDKS